MKEKAVLKFPVFMFTTIIVLFNCTKEKAQEEVQQPISIDCTSVKFTADVLPIFQNNCASATCHSTTNAEGGIRLSNYNEINAVDPNRILGSIKHESGYNPMPNVGPQLSKEKIALIECWINNGKPND